ncbi:hypothetical protein [Flavobacterium macacae]|uniref:hypothetical protein n=1 Tax=Flavobacterium macacae TaxID=2488993 RepID=UPI001315408C|nr:hypothetical protein [Flavobacterium macacae]
MGMTVGINTELIDFAIRTNYKSARTWDQFNKLRETQKSWRTLNTLGKDGAQYLKILKGAGAGIAIGTSAYSLLKAGTYYSNGGDDWRVGAKSALDIGMTVVGFFGPVGFAISATYFILDNYTDGFGGFGATN